MGYIDILKVYIDSKYKNLMLRVNNSIIESKLLFSQKQKFITQFRLNLASCPVNFNF